MTGLTPVVDAAVGRPAVHLAPWVRRYLGYRYEGFPPGVHLGLPSRHLTVVISLGAPTRLAALPPPSYRSAGSSGLTPGGTARVDEVAAEVGWSRRQLSHRSPSEWLANEELPSVQAAVATGGRG
ncbi:MAG: hypothetical protein ACRDPK_05800 [Carbonactinosporaceae bacterium]